MVGLYSRFGQNENRIGLIHAHLCPVPIGLKELQVTREWSDLSKSVAQNSASENHTVSKLLELLIMTPYKEHIREGRVGRTLWMILPHSKLSNHSTWGKGGKSLKRRTLLKNHFSYKVLGGICLCLFSILSQSTPVQSLSFLIKYLLPLF